MKVIKVSALKFVLFLMLGMSVCTLFSCKKDPKEDPPVTETDNYKINQWMLDTMRMDYLWEQDIPADGRLNLDGSPEDFFHSLLSSEDRFSWIENAEDLKNELNGVVKTAGLGVGLALISNDGDVIASVQYVYKDSPADAAKLKRGDLFLSVNNQPLKVNGDGYVPAANAVYGNDPFTLQLVKLNDEGKLVDDREVSLTPVEGFHEPSVLKDSVLKTSSGKKVGYLAYNSFLPDPGDLLAAFSRLKTASVNDLIIDLRYNGGGSGNVCALLAGMVQANFNENDVFIKYQYNEHYRDDNATYKDLLVGNGYQFIDDVKSRNLNLSRVFFLTTYGSASASELLINNLKPFLGESNIVQIGDTTYGKNVGSYTIEIDPENNPDKIVWGIQPIIVRTANKDGFGDYADGLKPLVENRVNEWDDLPWKPLASTEDPFIARALAIIDPSANARMSINRKSNTLLRKHGMVLKTIRNPAYKPRPVQIDKNTLKRVRLR